MMCFLLTMAIMYRDVSPSHPAPFGAALGKFG
jgi:hypothetical protein